ncbi:MAG: hypothetical protein FJX62_20240 [Alphaproteobacteria bacterium]|nr:hypothetical protein [Alphaproteobacteria bacterium]
MSISVVQGFVCFNSCDEAKARQGKNPHPKPGESEFSRPGVGGASDPSRSGEGGTETAAAVAPVDGSGEVAALMNGATGRVVDILV